MSNTVGVDVEGILDPLETIGRRGFGRYDVFCDWIDLMLSALQRDDNVDLDILKRYNLCVSTSTTDLPVVWDFNRAT